MSTPIPNRMFLGLQALKERSLARLQASIRASLVRLKQSGSPSASAHRESLNELLRRPGYAMPIVKSTGLRQSAALVEAVQEGKDREHIKRLLHQRANPNSFGRDGLAALHVACLHKRMKCIDLLLAAGADIELATRDQNPRRALHIVAPLLSQPLNQTGAEAVLLLLLAHGADPTVKMADGTKLENLIPTNKRLHTIVKSAQDAWEANESTILVTRPTLPHAIAAGNLARVRSLLRRSTDPDSFDEHGSAGSHLACARGDDMMLALLLANGANPNLPAKTDVGARPLHCAAFVGSVSCIDRLLKIGADPSLPDSTHRLPRERCGPLAQRARSMLYARARVNAVPPSVPVHVKRRGPTVELHLGQQQATEDSTNIPQLQLACQLELQEVGVALVDEDPREVMYLSLRHLFLGIKHEDGQLSVGLTLGQLQVDNCLDGTNLPVALSAGSNRARADNEESNNQDWSDRKRFELRVSHNLCYSYPYLDVDVLLPTLEVQLEQNFVARIIRFATRLTETLEKHLEQSLDSMSSRTATEEIKLETPLKVYLKKFRLRTVDISCTVQMESPCADPKLEPYHPTKQLAGVAKQLVALSNSHLQLSELQLDDKEFVSVDALKDQIVWHYTKQVLQGVYMVIGSLDMIGNPIGLFNDISGGVQTFLEFNEDVDVARRTKGLASGVVGGAARAASALTRNAGMVADALVYDSKYHDRQKKRRQEQVATTKTGINKGLEALTSGVAEGVQGIISKPIQGAMDQGAVGLIKGIGHGLVGAVAKPLSGVATFASKTSEGMAAEARRLVERDSLRRVRQPRALGPGVVLLPYPPKPVLPMDPYIPKLLTNKSESETASKQAQESSSRDESDSVSAYGD